MKPVTKKILSLSIVPSIFLFNGCSASSNGEIVNVSDIHTYNENYGVIPNPEVEKQLEEEILAQNKPVEVEIPKSDDPTITTELKIDPEAVTADKLIIPPPVITYKYMDDPKFYTENQIKNRER